MNYILPLNLLVVHKAASTLQLEIADFVNDILHEEAIRVTRIESDPVFKDNIFIQKYSNLNYICVLRHPLNKLISMYYSYGWTHNNPNQDPKRIEARQRARSKTLDEYIEFMQYSFIRRYDILLAERNDILHYENIMEYPKEYFKIISNRINNPVLLGGQSLTKALNDQFGNEFIKISDKSDDIIKGLYKGHKRNLDRLEYSKKLKSSTIDNLDLAITNLIKRYNNSKCLISSSINEQNK